VLFEDAFNALSAQLVAPEVAPPWIAAAVVGLLASDVFLPIPSSIVSTAAGALLGVVGGTLSSWTGMTIGALAAWAVGRSVGRPGLRAWVGEVDLARAEVLTARSGALALVLSRPVPVLAEASALLAGACGMPLGRFLAASTLANLGISLAYAAVGATAADVSSFLLAFFGAIGVPGLAMLIARRRRA
jgi:uncharacterized membrane protein YdjX (TVP38/TMEM64 family)